MAEIKRFGFHRGRGEHEPPAAAYIQIYVKSSALSRAPDLAISTHLTTEAVNDALAELEQVRIDAKKEPAQPSALSLVKALKMSWQFTVGVMAKGKVERIVVGAEDALIAALKVKVARGTGVSSMGRDRAQSPAIWR